MELKRIEVPFLDTSLIGDIAGVDPRILWLHGGGSSNRSRADALRQEFLDRGLGSVAFDCVGHGETGGSLVGSSLHSRTDQALAVVSYAKMKTPLTLLGSSMGAYTAVKLTEQLPIENLILLVPAAYDIKGYDVQFGEKFSEILRFKDSWNQSDAWQIMSRFQGRVLIIAGGKDDVIPPGVIQKLFESATSAKTRELITLPDVDHRMLLHLTANNHDRELFFAAVDRMNAN